MSIILNNKGLHCLTFSSLSLVYFKFTFFLSYFVMIPCSWCRFDVQSVGLCIGATVMEFKKSIVVAAVYGLSCMLLGGFYQKNIPSWLSWFQYTAYIAYSYEAALSIEFSTSPTFRLVITLCFRCFSMVTVVTQQALWKTLYVSITLKTDFDNLVFLFLNCD